MKDTLIELVISIEIIRPTKRYCTVLTSRKYNKENILTDGLSLCRAPNFIKEQKYVSNYPICCCRVEEKQQSGNSVTGGLEKQSLFR